MPRRNYPKQRRLQRSKRARQHRREAHYARMRRITAHCSHISFRWNRMGDPVYRQLLAKRIRWMERLLP